VNQETFKWKRYPLPAARFHGNSSQVDSKNRIWLSIGRAKYLFDPKTEKFRYLIGFDWSHRNSDILCGSVKEDARANCGWQHGHMDFTYGMRVNRNLKKKKRTRVINCF
jgi:streptogramin lyase